MPHVVGKTQADVEYGAGWATAEDRGLLLGLIRGPARVAALDVPGLNPIGLALSGTTFSPSAQTEAFLAKQTALLPPSYRAILQAYVAGINAYYRKTGTPTEPYTTNDVVAAAALIAARFGANGGQEAANAQFLSALQARFGADRGRKIFDDLREPNDPEAPVSLPGSFQQEPVFSPAPGSVLLDDASFGVAAVSERRAMSNALLVGAKRSATGHPLFVAGPQVGYFFPEFFLEVARWRARHALPRHVFVHTNLNPKPFYVDLGSPLLVDLLRRAVSAIAGQSDGTLYVTEMLPGPDQLWLRGDRGRHASEILVQLEGPAEV